MLADFKVSPNLVLHIESSNQLDLFKQLGQLKEIFGISECSKCQSNDIRHVVREVDDPNKKGKTYDYYELHCQSCRSKLAFGVKQDGETLFPKRKDQDGKWLDNNGWTQYKKE